MTSREQTHERRRASRLSDDSGIVLRISACSMRGSSENVSRSGVLFHTDEALPVEIELHEDGVVKKLQGRLIRTERIAEGQQGWAVEFDPA